MNKKIIVIFSLAIAAIAVLSSAAQFLQAQEFKRTFSSAEKLNVLEGQNHAYKEIVSDAFDYYSILFMLSFSKTDTFKEVYSRRILEKFFWFWCLQQEGFFDMPPDLKIFLAYKALLSPYIKQSDLLDPLMLNECPLQDRSYILGDSLRPLKFTMQQYEDAVEKFYQIWDATELESLEVGDDVPCAE